MPDGRTRKLLLATPLFLLLCCAPLGAYVWVDDFHPAPTPDRQSYLIAPGDMLQVRVFSQDQLTTRARVRADGKVSLPLLNDVEAAGLTPVALGQKLESQLKDFIKNPLVTVSLEEPKLQSVFVSGEVIKAGTYPLEAAPGVLQAIVNAGGLSLQATTDRIFVLRQGPTPLRIRFTYEALIHLTGDAARFRLQAGDVVVVE